MTDLPLKPKVRFDRVALAFIIDTVVAPLAPSTWYRPNHINNEVYP
jgi:hypothetical protein